jgi:hypothetical protein
LPWVNDPECHALLEQQLPLVAPAATAAAGCISTITQLEDSSVFENSSK